MKRYILKAHVENFDGSRSVIESTRYAFHFQVYREAARRNAAVIALGSFYTVERIR